MLFLKNNLYSVISIPFEKLELKYSVHLGTHLFIYRYRSDIDIDGNSNVNNLTLITS